jgi:hypothetical protein
VHASTVLGDVQGGRAILLVVAARMVAMGDRLRAIGDAGQLFELGSVCCVFDGEHADMFFLDFEVAS